MFGIGRGVKRIVKSIQLKGHEKELFRIENLTEFKTGTTAILGKPFKFNHGPSFVNTYREIFQNEIYKFAPSPSKHTILDCGANMGLSVLFFSINYPHHKIIAFEPDADIFALLEENVSSFGLRNVELHQKAVWNKDERLEFFTDHGMGGRVGTSYSNQTPRLIETVILKNMLDQDIDFLKLDIEGAEDIVIKDCREKLSEAGTLFFEYHNNINQRQTLHELLEIVQKAGFHYYIKESGTRKRPFLDKELICETFDMAINVFCYRT